MPVTFGSSFLRSGLIQSRIAAHWVVGTLRVPSGGGSSRQIACSFAIGPTSNDFSFSADQIVARYFALTPSATAMFASVAFDGTSAARCLYFQQARKYAARSVGCR